MYGDALAWGGDLLPLQRARGCLGFFFFEHGQRECVTRLSPSQAVRNCLRAVLSVSSARVCGFGARLPAGIVGAVPVYHYSFEPDGGGG